MISNTCRVVTLLFLTSFSITSLSKEPDALVIYSKYSFDKYPIYAKVLGGIERKLSITKVEVTDESNIQSILDARNPRRIIVLGKSIADEVAKTNHKDKMIVGLTYFQNSNYYGVNMALDAQVVAKKLSELLPSIKRIEVIQQDGFKTINNDDSKKIGQLEFNSVTDPLDVIRMTSKIIDEADQSTAVIVPPNILANLIFEMSKVAWERKVALISTNLNHLDSGILMVIFPDEEKMGESIGALFTNPSLSAEDTIHVKVGVNKRTAQHLSQDFSKKQLGEMSVIINDN